MNDNMAIKRLREEEEEETMVDRLSDMPESLQLRILSFLDTRHAIETSVLSKSWVSSWTSVPVLNFSCCGTVPDLKFCCCDLKQFHVFDNFVMNALSRREPVKLDRLTLKRGGEFNAEFIKKVFDYAVLHGVEELEAYVVPRTYAHKDWIWPICSSSSLTSLKLRSTLFVSCSFLEPRSVGSFKNLTNLDLEGVIISDLDPFSGFPVLDKLRLFRCYLDTNGNALNVHAPQLSEFTFFYYSQDVNSCKLTTPKLRYFEWRGNGLPRLDAHLPLLEKAVINYDGHCRKMQEEKIMCDNLLVMFDTLYTAKSLTVSAHIVRLLTLFPLNECSPFRDLKALNLNFSSRYLYYDSKLFLSETSKLVPVVKAYLLHKSRDAKCTIIDDSNPCSSSQKSMCSTTQRQAGTQQTVSSRPKRMVKKPARFLD